MGLDAFIKSFPSDTEVDSVGHVKAPAGGEFPDSEEIGYFRKVNWLHNWMQILYAERSGITDASEFNCVHVELTSYNLIKLQQDILTNNITPVEGFFFGQSKIYPEDKAEVFKVIGKAFAALSEGKVVTYSSWW